MILVHSGLSEMVFDLIQKAEIDLRPVVGDQSDCSA